jgi:undecaprenyl diphosphate synthase
MPPRHVAIIMDGNGRWAVSRGKIRLEGHRAGAKKVLEVIDWCKEAGVAFLTLYAFSTENWKRSAEEVDGLMKLMGLLLRTKVGLFVKSNVRVRVIGRKEDLPAPLQRQIASAERRTAHCDGLNLQVAVSYGGRAEIADAAMRYAQDVLDGKAEAGAVPSDEVFRRYLYAPDVPDPDLIIRTSGEFRLSNFLLWESAYSEFWKTDTLWPDFGKDEFEAALESFSGRERRMGGRSE